MINNYVKENRYRITASKLKTYLKNPVEFYLKYVKEVEVPGQDKRYFVIGGAFDDLVSYGEEYFLEKYYIDKGLVKDELLKEAIRKGEISAEVLRKRKLPELRSYMYEGRKEKKIRITKSEGDDIMGMYREVKRQPLMDFGSKYETQYEVVCKYKGLMLRGRLDRYSKERKLIRDRKTSGKIDFFEYDMEETFDYILSMAFYYTLIKIAEGIECDVILDIIAKQKPYQSIMYKIERYRLLDKMKTKVIPGLEKLIQSMEKNEWLPVYPLTGQAIPRSEMMKSEYYSLMDCTKQTTFTDPV